MGRCPHTGDGPSMPHRMNRRALLRAAGLGLALPMLESLGVPRRAAPPARGTARRLVVIGPALGLYTPALYPRTPASEPWTSPLLEPLAGVRDQLSLFAGLDHRARNGHEFWRTFLTGPEPRSVSLDQRAVPVIGTETRYASLQLCAGRPGAGEVMSVTPEGIALPMIFGPREVFARLFGTGADQDHAAYLLESDASVLDAVRADARRLKQRVSAADAEKLDEYFTALRAVETDLAHERSWLSAPKPVVAYTVPELNPLASAQMFACAQVMYDLMLLALQTDSARVSTLYFPKFSPVFQLGGRKLIAGYHALSHHNGDEDMIRDLIEIDRTHMTLFAGFLQSLQSSTDAEGRPLLDSTVVVFGSGMGDASRHSNADLPVIVAGGGLRHGRFHDHRRAAGASPDEGPVLSDLFVTLLRALGVETSTFANSRGDLDGELA